MIRILFVCLGNICRSPLAEAIMKTEIKRNGLENEITVDSAGTGGWHVGEPADKRSKNVGNTYKVPVDSIARVIETDDFYEFDYIVGMDEENLNNIFRLQPDDANAEVLLMREFDPKGGKNVPDPYYGGEAEFEEVFRILSRSCTKLLDYVKEKHGIAQEV